MVEKSNSEQKRTELMREQSEKYLRSLRMHQDTPHGQSEYLIKII